jgi:glycosyltransferase involved in cell wall biosynthesis
MDDEKKILIIDFCNYEDYPIGGFLSFCKNMVASFGNSLALVGITTEEDEPVGQWFKKKIGQYEFDFFALKRYKKNKTMFLLPDRLVSFVTLQIYRKRIMDKGFRNVFIQRQEMMPAVKSFGINNICYCFPGMENPLSISKYWYGKYLSKRFDKVFFSSFENTSTVLATGDEKAIHEMLLRSNGKLNHASVIKFPSRFDADIFKPGDKKAVRQQLGLPDDKKIIVTTGRLTWLKGWKLMIDSFVLFVEQQPESIFIMVGEGEDEEKIKAYLAEKQLVDKVVLTGRKSLNEVAAYLKSADLFIMGSYKEGWSTSLIEATACGLPSCVTSFSSANSIVLEGKNGFVIPDHNETLFSAGMLKALQIETPVDYQHVLPYSVKNLKNELLKVWKLV